MATHDYVIANGTGAAVRSDLNNALAAIVSNNSGSSEPGTTYAYQWWADTNANVLKLRNSSNDGWVTLRELDGTMLIEDGSASSPGLAFADDTNTGIFSNSADQINFATGGVERLKIDGTETVFNNPSNDVDFRVESNGQTHMLYINAENDRIGIGHSSPGVTLDVNGEVRSHHTSDSRFLLEVNDVNKGGFSATTDAGVVIYGASSTNPIRFQTSGSEKARIDTDGRLLVGTTSDKSISSDANALVQIFTSSAGKLLIGRSDASVVADDALGIIDFHTFDGGSQRGARIAAKADGAHASGDVPSRIEFSTCADNSSTLTERLRIHGNGLVQVKNRLGNGASGDTFEVQSYDSDASFAVGSDGNNSTRLQMRNSAGDNTIQAFGHSGRVLSTGGFITGNTDFFTVSSSSETGNYMRGGNEAAVFFRSGGIPMYVGRQGSDGTLIGFRQAGSQEGTISVSGSTVSYNGAHLSRWSQLAGGAERTEILRGSVLSNLDEMCEWAYDAQDAVLYTEEDELPEGVSVGDVKTPARDAGTEDNEQLNRMKVSDVEGDPNVAGVFQGWDDDDDTYDNDFYCAMTGDFVIRIAQGTTVARGDLLMSAGDGTAKPQDDDIVRSKTIAKVTSTTVSTTYSDGSYCVPCVLMAC